MSDNGKSRVLVTGGSGYVGSHTVVELLSSGYFVVVLDNLVNSKAACIRRIEQLCGSHIPFYTGDLVDRNFVESVFAKEKIESVIHFAALKSVSSSIREPLRYYENNTVGLVNLISTMNAHSIKDLVFSSSCTVYGVPKFLPLTEQHPMGHCTSPYGTTKHFAETMLSDLYEADPTWNIICLRYFNPVGAHPSAQIGEYPNDRFSNLMPCISQVAAGRLPHVNVYGSDYDTPDKTGIRDYVHIVDVAKAHVCALQKLSNKCGYKAYNIGTGKGYSVLEVIRAMEQASGKPIPYQLHPRRPGDTDILYANPDLAHKELNWEAKYDLDKMCEDQWRWQCQNPHGYDEEFKSGDH
ncbi:UDP-N-acetylglucosamine 4-epimerase/UDP-glucose 4-epimerase [Fasciolopsis buskii]|uniref:UDP-glucose 4-epimerase n=1 Tax=Fasciolopsis buskii TaxID=27845 RepID=A0A8E0RJE2_9TREM|nr:UDP-N-acetylglucosamine 4-epimerase/UDP-glucose 4-epimerase [Fasciolopsis buski]